MLTIRPALKVPDPRALKRAAEAAAAEVKRDSAPALHVAAEAGSSLGPFLAKAKSVLGSVFGKISQGLKWLVFGKLSKLESREVLDDPDSTSASSSELGAARAYMSEHASDEAQALARLGEAKATYAKLAQLTADDLPARQALMTMLLDGRLTKKALRGGEDMLTHLGRLATGPLADGLDRKALLTNLIEEAENPLKIAQQGKGTCVATSSTILLDRQNPSEYVRLIAEMARPEGTATLQNGVTLTRSATWNDDGDWGRTPSVRLLQPALMEYGNFFLDYDNVKDGHHLGPLPAGGGLNAWGADRVLEGLTGKKFMDVFAVTRLNRGWTMKRIEKALAEGKSVPVGMFWDNLGSSGHQVLVDKIEGGWVTFSNPWGERDRMKLSEFEANLQSAQIPQ